MEHPDFLLKTNLLILLAIGSVDCLWFRTGFLSDNLLQPKGAASLKVITPPCTPCIKCFPQGCTKPLLPLYCNLSPHSSQSCFLYSFTHNVPENTPNKSPACTSLPQNLFSGSPILQRFLLIFATQAPTQNLWVNFFTGQHDSFPPEAQLCYTWRWSLFQLPWLPKYTSTYQ